MSQNINLLGTAVHKPQQLPTLLTLAQCLGLTLAVLFGYHFYLQQQVSGLTAELRAAEGLLGSQRGLVEKQKGKLTAPRPDAQLDADIARLEAELKSARESLGALTGGAAGSQQGFAEYLRAFSRQTLSGLWLTGFSIAGSGELEIRGRALSPDLLPNYIQRLNREQVLAGRSIGRLEMSRPKPDPASPKDQAAGKVPPLPRFLEFSLATMDPVRAEKTP